MFKAAESAFEFAREHDLEVITAIRTEPVTVFVGVDGMTTHYQQWCDGRKLSPSGPMTFEQAASVAPLCTRCATFRHLAGRLTDLNPHAITPQLMRQWAAMWELVPKRPLTSAAAAVRRRQQADSLRADIDSLSMGATPPGWKRALDALGELIEQHLAGRDGRQDALDVLAGGAGVDVATAEDTPCYVLTDLRTPNACRALAVGVDGPRGRRDLYLVPMWAVVPLIRSSPGGKRATVEMATAREDPATVALLCATGELGLQAAMAAAAAITADAAGHGREVLGIRPVQDMVTP